MGFSYVEVTGVGKSDLHMLLRFQDLRANILGMSKHVLEEVISAQGFLNPMD